MPSFALSTQGADVPVARPRSLPQLFAAEQG